MLVFTRAADDCALNGAKSSSGRCICDPGWVGEHCEQLDLGGGEVVFDSNYTQRHLYHVKAVCMFLWFHST